MNFGDMNEAFSVENQNDFKEEVQNDFAVRRRRRYYRRR